MGGLRPKVVEQVGNSTLEHEGAKTLYRKMCMCVCVCGEEGKGDRGKKRKKK